MHLQTVLLIRDNGYSVKPNQHSHLLKFLHPLKILKKINNQLQCQKGTKIQKKSEISLSKNKQRTNQLFGFNKKVNQNQNLLDSSLKKHQIHTQNTFNEDEGILQHLFNRFHLQQQTSSMKYGLQSGILKRTQEVSEQNPKCFILFGICLGMLEMEQFLSLHPQINLTIKLYKYDHKEFYKSIDIVQSQDNNIQESLQKLRRINEQNDVLNCEELTFVLNLWRSHQNQESGNDGINMGEIYFFPSINTVSSHQQVEEQRKNKLSSQLSSTVNMADKNSSLRKSHQNFRIVQVLQYYLSLECHSEHIMISSGESLVIRDFLAGIYEKSLREFYIYIDYEGKQMHNGRKDKKNQHTNRSIMPQQRDSNEFMHISASHTSNWLSSGTEYQLVSINGLVLPNDQFLSKLSSIKLPYKCTDSEQFRKQKQLMYRMKLQEYLQERQLRRVKKQFTSTINYLNSLIGLEQLSYDQISIQSLKTIKNAKIKQSTQQLKEMLDLSKQKQLRYQELKNKIALYEKLKHQHHEHNQHKLSQLRKEMTELQKQLNLQKNQLTNLYEMQSAQQTNDDHPKSTHPNRQSQNDSKISTNSLKLEDYDEQQLVKTKNIPTKNTNKQQQNFMPSKPKISQTSNLSPKAQLKLKQSNLPQQSTIQQNSRVSMSPKIQNIPINRHSSQQFLNKYAPILQQLRKQKYEAQLKQERTRCQFQAQKQFEKLKQEYKKATKDLLLVLGDYQ